MIFRLQSKLAYLIKARHRHGFGIHSPFLFRLISNVIEDKKPYPAYEIFRSERKKIKSRIKNTGNFSGADFEGKTIRGIWSKKKLYKRSELEPRYGKLVFRLVNEFKPQSICFFGPTFGLNLLYLALSNKGVRIDFFQSGNILRRISKISLEEAGILNVRYFNEEEEPIDLNHEFIFINSMLFPVIIKRLSDINNNLLSENRVMIIKGIHESKIMESVWNDMVRSKAVSVSLDLFEIGILLFDRKLQKEHFILKC